MPTNVATFHQRVLIAADAANVRDIMADPDALFALLQPRDVTLSNTGDGWRITSAGRLGERVITFDRMPEKDGDIVYHSTSGGFIATTTINVASGAATSLTVNIKVQAANLKARLSAPLVRMAQGKINGALDRALNRLAKKLARRLPD